MQTASLFSQFKPDHGEHVANDGNKNGDGNDHRHANANANQLAGTVSFGPIKRRLAFVVHVKRVHMRIRANGRVAKGELLIFC